MVLQAIIWNGFRLRPDALPPGYRRGRLCAAVQPGLAGVSLCCDGFLPAERFTRRANFLRDVVRDDNPA